MLLGKGSLSTDSYLGMQGSRRILRCNSRTYAVAGRRLACSRPLPAFLAWRPPPIDFPVTVLGCYASDEPGQFAGSTRRAQEDGTFTVPRSERRRLPAPLFRAKGVPDRLKPVPPNRLKPVPPNRLKPVPPNRLKPVERSSSIVVRYETCRLPNCGANSGSSTPP